jgi:hypothetical protein
MKEFHCGITIDQISMLEQTFAEYTINGWVIPNWLNDLRIYVTNRDRAALVKLVD